MLDIRRDIQSLSPFKRHPSELLRQLKETGEPIILALNSKAALVMQDVKTYQPLFECIQRRPSAPRWPERPRTSKAGPTLPRPGKRAV